MITIICEDPKKEESKTKLKGVINNIKLLNPDVKIRIRIIKHISYINSFVPEDEEYVIVFGSKLYSCLLKDINEFDKLTGSVSKRDVHKFSYFIQKKNIHYFLACMPPIDFAMSKPETFLAFESCIKSLITATENFKIDLKSVYINKCKTEHKGWELDVIENGFSPKNYLYLKYEEIKKYLLSLLDLPNWHIIAIDTETTGLRIWDKLFHDILIMSFSTEDNIGHAINLGLPGLSGCFTKDQLDEIHELIRKYIFEKPKVFIAWNCGYDIFTICNKYNKSYHDFCKNNKIIDGMQMLHIFSENRKIEGYGFKAASRDFLGYAQYSFLEKYLHYLEHWKEYTIEQILHSAISSLQYAAEDAAGEKTLTSMLIKELEIDDISKVFKEKVAPEIMNVKLETEWNGIKIDTENMVKNSMSFAGWEIDKIVKPTIELCKEATDNRAHAETFVFSTTLGRLLYKKPILHQMKIKTNLAEYFIADEGCSFVYVDLSSADLRSAALLSQDYNLIKELNGEDDFYLNLAKTLFGQAEEKEREQAKIFALSMLNLAGDDTIARESGLVGNVKIYKDSFYKKYPNMLLYRNKLKNFLKKNSFIFGPTFRKRRFSEDDMMDENFWKSFLSAHNFPYASLTSDMMLMNCFRFINNTKDFNIKQCYINVDAAAFNIPDEYLEEVKYKFKTFEEVPGIVLDGVIKFQEDVMEIPPKTGLSLNIPKFKYKLFKGKNLKDMELWNVSI
jgi:DNA polymerase I-like protein with 3'-5' exonuclease and polymerase domains